MRDRPEEGLDAVGFTDWVAARVRECYPGTAVRVVETLRLELEGEDYQVQVNLGNLFRTYCTREDPSEDLERFVASLAPDALEPQGIEAVVAVVRSSAFLSSFRAQAEGLSAVDAAGALPVSFPLAADLHVLLAFDLPDQVRFLCGSDLEELALAKEQLLGYAVENVMERMGEVRCHQMDEVFALEADGTFEASLLLRFAMWEELEELVEGELVAAAPVRDLVLFTGTAMEGGIAQLTEQVERLQQTGSYPLSRTLLRRRGKRWESLVTAN